MYLEITVPNSERSGNWANFPPENLLSFLSALKWSFSLLSKLMI